MSSQYYTDDTPVKPFGKGICEAYGCTSVAITTININIGEIDFITLYLCEKCALDFERN